MNTPRSIVAIILLSIISVGLTTRMQQFNWSHFVAANAGDALWAMALYLALWFVRPITHPLQLLGLTVLLCIAVEFQQLLQWPWLVELRQTLPGKLLLGQGFVWMDFPRYAVGACAGFLLHLLLRGRFG